MSLLQIQQLEYQHCGPIDLQLEASECVGLSGESGSGKSLMLRAIADLDEHKGVVQVNDDAADSVTAPEWRTRVALLPAESQWWFDTVGEHFTANDHSELFKMLGFTDEVMGWSISRMSSGEKQRLALLRVLLNRPEVLLLDEPTANLDRENTRVFEQIVRDYLDKNRACALWISHDLDQLKRVSARQLKLEQGHLRELQC